jgi:hypothetical protein
MNERIRELTKQAEIKFEAHPQHSGIVTAVITPADLERFAELIVKECAEVAANVVAEHEGVDFGLVEKCYEHFGVDE